jgi:hypothetical protein
LNDLHQLYGIIKKKCHETKFLKENGTPPADLHSRIRSDNGQPAGVSIQYRYQIIIYKSKNSFYEKEYIH